METIEIMDKYPHDVYKERYEQYYGDNIYSFYIFIKKSSVNFEDIEKLVEIYKPAHTKANIVVLNKHMILGEHLYVGVNSSIMGKAAPQLNEDTALPFNSVLIDERGFFDEK